MRPTTRSGSRRSWSRRLRATTSRSPRNRSSTGAAPAGRSRAASSTSAARSSNAIQRGRNATRPRFSQKGSPQTHGEAAEFVGNYHLRDVLNRLKPYLLHSYLLTYTPILLLADRHITE